MSLDRFCFHLGRPKDPALIGSTDRWSGPWRAPWERPDEGCPGGYQVCGFVLSVLRFYRRRDKAGNRVANPLFDGADWLVQTAVMYLETVEDRYFNAVESVITKPVEQPKG